MELLAILLRILNRLVNTLRQTLTSHLQTKAMTTESELPIRELPKASNGSTEASPPPFE